jgi:hypothetical protein
MNRNAVMILQTEEHIFLKARRERREHKSFQLLVFSERKFIIWSLRDTNLTCPERRYCHLSCYAVIRRHTQPVSVQLNS